MTIKTKTKTKTKTKAKKNLIIEISIFDKV
jgi:hypothetical protein